ncbi:unnamed protein product [Pseudo-nitzschia multistriata]|uniref:Protein HIRA-like C-terminal domain-containing protein n=1 Tax=Pseudo-nitzschia multistriata TaxID=183589 RepID=A0A448YVK3_9STRA|nr:unnamed protein product [Pseudo-nitzschia multistriata]
MVIAEVPLWVVHSNSNAPKGDGKAPASSAGASSPSASAKDRATEARASESLRLLSSLGGSSSSLSPAGLQRAGIYGIDVHGSKFATGGGDGTVRIWSVGALFPTVSGEGSSSTSSSIKGSRYRKGTGGGLAQTPGAANGGDDAGSSSDDPAAMDGTLQTIATASGNHCYESSGESSQDDSLVGDPESTATGASNGNRIGNHHQHPVRDLSSVVRKKGEAAAPVSPSASGDLPDPSTPPSAGPNAGETPAPEGPGGRQKHHRLLCTLSAHTGSSVLAVRFSNNGRYLASAGDDAVVCIYARQARNSIGAMVASGNLVERSEDGPVLEHWTRIKLCRGHGLDVVGLAWAPDDSHLVSCSLDSNTPIVVWKLTDLAEQGGEAQHNGSSNGGGGGYYQHNYNNVLCNPYKVLGRGIHTSTVKGVTFDPAGTYLASSGDDPSVCIWRAHDDWGLERRIDAASGIFRKWSTAGGSGHAGATAGLATTSSLSAQSLFRRLSWSTDGAYICATNAVVRNKNVASTISREGWAVSGSKTAASGAVNLVGHKQPVVASRHCPYLLKNASQGGNGSDDDDDDPEPDYSTLLALGDKRGFVTVWSTRKSRPVFKIQCSESRCTVTDLAWGRCGNAGDRAVDANKTSNNNSNTKNNDLMLLVSLLDGQVVALRFGIPDELGSLLSPREQGRVFQLRYGIDPSDLTSSRRLFVGDNSGGPKLIENALQFALENHQQHQQQIRVSTEEEGGEANSAAAAAAAAAAAKERSLTSEEIQKRQLESRSRGGKKRIQPLLMMQTSPLQPPTKKQKTTNGEQDKEKAGAADTLESALELAEKAASGAEAVTAAQKTASKTTAITGNDHHHQQQQQQQQQQLQHHHRDPSAAHHHSQNIQLLAGASQSTPQIPHNTDRIHSVDLPLLKPNPLRVGGETAGNVRYVADCTNSIRVPAGSSGGALPCSVLSISKGGQSLWKDQLPGSTCCAIAASKSWLVVGTSDGCLQIYGTSPTLGWQSASAFRSHPPFVLGRPIVALHLREGGAQTELLVVSSDGRFGVYVLEPRLKLLYKGSLLPAMTHVLLSADLQTDLYLPKLARIQLTETNRLLLLLSLRSASTPGRNSGPDEGRAGRGTNQAPSVGAGGSLQGFVYDLESELWMRVADSRFVLSDFYNSLPSFSSLKKQSTTDGPLSKLDDYVRMGAGSSSLQRSRRARSILGNSVSFQTSTVTTTSRQNDDEANNDVDSRSHCEDRMACALALGSVSEFEFWFSMYVKILALTGNEVLLRLVIDMLMGKYPSGASNGEAACNSTCWWLSESPMVLTFDRVKLVSTVVIPEMSKNRALQRLTNEIAVEVELLHKK